ncbi:hypothetical protein HMPREF1624_02948 [Sporothrix schenckii ATCC 58251]|uniref:Amidohydrolase 3 domain-containing protein n=1 Tax=Sporothrix schenckii (strain ATCC 58251 / de Perez 2211183) TaxID=1391915 RepID=U7Q3U5_SPOS1|nr:hypothetical protein HMPREF1624_02948 [Sporothrix schenckii ATCC 58251]
MDTKDDGFLPPYTAVDQPGLPRWDLGGKGSNYNINNNNHFHGYRRTMRRRARRIRAAVVLAIVVLVGYTHWRHTSRAPPLATGANGSLLSIAKLEADLATCATLKSEPQSAQGAGRERNARYVDGKPATLIRNATVWTGEPDPALLLSLSDEDIRAGKGFGWATADVYIENGLIQRVEASIDVASLRPAAGSKLVTWDAHGRQLTAGIIDMHSHAGVGSLPSLRGNEDSNEMSSDITPYVRSKDGIQPLDHQIQVIKSGGVTTSLVLPGSANNIGGEAFVIKHAVGRHDGRAELSIASLLAAPDTPALRYIKMACGENAKRVYGKVGEHGPTSRLGEAWEFRHAFEQAAAYVQAQDDWCATAESAVAAAKTKTGAGAGTHWAHTLTSYLPRAIEWETLAGVLRGQVYVNTHCYTVPDLESFVGYTNEFRFNVRAFHHAHQTFLVPEVLKRTWGADKYGPPASAIFADNMYYKAESQVATEYAGKILWDHGLTPVYVSDNPVLNAQHVLFEAAKGYRYGLPYHAALASVTTAPAERLGLGDRIGKIKPGFDADIAVWDSDPLSVGAAPVQVWIDGNAQFDDPVELGKPASSPIVPDTRLARIPDEPVDVADDVVFTGVSQVWIDGLDEAVAAAQAAHASFAVAVSKGEIVCIGACEAHVAAAQNTNKAALVALENGHLTHAFTAVGALLGLNEIDAESATDNGAAGDVFSRAVDGLALGGTKLRVAHRYGVTRAVSAPKFRGGFTHYGTSAGFLTGAAHALDGGAVFAADAALHYTLSLSAKHGSTPTIASAVGALRGKLLKAVADNKANASATDGADIDVYSEAAFLRQVVAGTLPLVVTVHSADAIAAVLRVKKDVEAAASTASTAPIRLTVLGGAESHLLADALAAAHVGVVLAPLQSYATEWDQRRALTGAPLTNGTAVDILVDAGVVVGIGLEEDWVVRDLGLLAGIAYRNGGGRLSERAALALVSTNLDSLLGLEKKAAATPHFVVHEGNPLAINSRVKAVGNGQGRLTVFA